MAQTIMQQLDACDEQLQSIMTTVIDRQDRLDAVSEARRMHEVEAARLHEKAKQLQTESMI